MAPTRDAVDEFLTAYGNTLVAYDAAVTAAMWGMPGTMVTDVFTGSLSSRDEMAAGLAQGYPLYRQLGLGGIGHTLLEFAPLTDVVVRVRVRWHFTDDAGDLLTDSDYEYVLREDPDGLHVYVAVDIDADAKLRELAARRGVDLPDR
ncbi:conserved hypothetical protein [Rhodococcus sp. RD6.2]|uniref:hypothetical protein n=1 Tax=Rhodococcus sp. RD6.2 TaxID=260936 RepID=UPI00063B6C76|nr:hypothetical protein [Rhodococcus sp. RD6.2]CRK54333.1 conserved hypothetical protein [Rhodococcus sp. RD6.2]